MNIILTDSSLTWEIEGLDSKQVAIKWLTAAYEIRKIDEKNRLNVTATQTTDQINPRPFRLHKIRQNDKTTRHQRISNIYFSWSFTQNNQTNSDKHFRLWI